MPFTFLGNLSWFFFFFFLLQNVIQLLQYKLMHFFLPSNLITRICSFLYRGKVLEKSNYMHLIVGTFFLIEEHKKKETLFAVYQFAKSCFCYCFRLPSCIINWIRDQINSFLHSFFITGNMQILHHERLGYVWQNLETATFQIFFRTYRLLV